MVKKLLAGVLALAIVLSLAIIPSVATDLVIDFNTEEGRATAEFFGQGCQFKPDAGTGSDTVAYLVNEAGGKYDNGIAVTFDAPYTGSASIEMKLICPDHINGATGYQLHHRTNSGNYHTEVLSAVEDHSYFTYTIQDNVVAGTNILYLVQGGNDGNGNGWRIDVATLSFTFSVDEAVFTTKIDAYTSHSGNPDLWVSNLSSHPGYCAAVFGAAAPFCGISALSNWASNLADWHRKCIVNVQLHKYDGFSYETSVAEAPLETVIYAPEADGQPFNWTLSKFYPAGEYVFSMCIDFENSTGDQFYFVFPSVTGEPFPSGTVYYPTIKFPFSITFQETNVESYFTPVEVIGGKEEFTTPSEGNHEPAMWMASYVNNRNRPGRTVDIVINPSHPIESVGTRLFYASNPANEGQVKATIKISVYKFNYDYVTSVLGDPVAYASFETEGDNNLYQSFESATGLNGKLTNYNPGGGGVALVFDTPLPKGQYVVRFENVSPYEGDSYLVLPSTAEAYPNNKAAYYNNGVLNTGVTTALGVRFATGGVLNALISDTDSQTVVLADGGGMAYELSEKQVSVLVSVPEGKALYRVVGKGSPTWGNVTEGSNAKAEIYAWRGDYETSLRDTVLATATVTDHKDNDDAIFLFDKQVTAGKYLIVFTSTSASEKQIGFWGGTDNNQNIIKTFVNGKEETFYPRSEMVLVAEESAPNPVDPEPFFIGDMQIKKASITLKNSIAVNLKLDPAAFVAGYYTDPTATVTINGRTTTLTADENYVFTLEDIGPEELGDQITVVAAAKHNGETVTAEAFTYSVKDYLLSLLDDAGSSAQLKKLAVNILKYGAAAQQYTGHNTDALVTSALTDEQLALGTSGAPALTAGGKGISKTGIDAAATWISAGLNLEDAVTVKFMFAADDVDGLSVKFEFKGKEYVVTSDQFKAVGSGRYVVYFEGVYADEMRELVTATVYSGNTAVSETVTYSVEAYAYVKGTGNDVLANLVNAMMAYGDSAAAYVD